MPQNKIDLLEQLVKTRLEQPQAQEFLELTVRVAGLSEEVTELALRFPTGATYRLHNGPLCKVLGYEAGPGVAPTLCVITQQGVQLDCVSPEELLPAVLH